MKQLPNRLREFREAARLSQTQLAERTGKAFQTISEYETGKQKMPPDFLVKAAEVLMTTQGKILEEPTRLSEAVVPYRAVSAIDQKDYIAVVNWLVARDKDRGALFTEARSSALSLAGKTIITTAIHVADEADEASPDSMAGGAIPPTSAKVTADLAQAVPVKAKP